MPGFPGRPSRDAFGPTRKNDGEVTDPEKYVDGDTFNLEHWQTAGMGLITARARATLNWTGSALELVSAAEAWDPNADQADPTPARSAAGVYTLTYESTYPDVEGNDVATALTDGAAFVQATGGTYAAVAVPRSDGKTVDIEVKNGVILTDAKVLVVLW